MVSLTKRKVEYLFMNKIVFEVVSKFARSISLSEATYDHVCSRHPEVFGEIDEMKKTLSLPHVVRKSMYDEKVWLFYRFFEETPVTEKYLMVAAKILNNEGLVVTSYFTDKIKMGVEIWRER